MILTLNFSNTVGWPPAHRQLLDSPALHGHRAIEVTRNHKDRRWPGEGKCLGSTEPGQRQFVNLGKRLCGTGLNAGVQAQGFQRQGSKESVESQKIFQKHQNVVI